MAITGKNIIAGDMRHVLHSFGLKGKKNYSTHLPAAIQSVEPMAVDKLGSTVLALVALANGEVSFFFFIFIC